MRLLFLLPLTCLARPGDEDSDLMANGTIIHPADWSAECDPWKLGALDVSTAYENDPYDDWVCPEQNRSMSGCGDFELDTRGTTCDEPVLLPRCSDRRVMSIAEPLLPQKHACVQHPIGDYDNYGTGSGVTAPTLGRHRERWAKYGEYEFLPPQRWLHNAEHGAAIFLYNPCLTDEALCELRKYIWSRPDDELYGEDATMSGRDEAGNFRWILTPYPNLRTKIAVVTWGNTFYSNCLNEPGMTRFLAANYRNAWEDWPPSGPYDYLWVDDSSLDSCAKPDPATEVSEQANKAREWNPPVTQINFDFAGILN